jgi:uncharacterized protein YjiS (DUF1127 family)
MTMSNALPQVSRRRLGQSMLRAASRVATQLLWRDNCPAWYELNDHLLRDIGKTAADAEFEALQQAVRGLGAWRNA